MSSHPHPPPNRTAVWCRPVLGGVEVGCDCGIATQLIFDFDRIVCDCVLDDFYVCDGCGSVHWFTVTRETAAEAGR